MRKFPFPHQGRRTSLIWPCALATFGWIALALPLSADPKDGPGPGTGTAVESDKSTPTPQDSVSKGPTYLGDIRPIFMGSCARCHNQQSRFVYDWLDYKTAYSDRWEIKRRVWDSWKGSYYKEPMPVANSPESLALTDAQRATIKEWVESGAPEGVAPAAPPAGTVVSKEDQIAAGKRIFTACAACHQPTGQGVPNVFPPLAGSDFLNADKARAIGIILHGKRGEVVVNGVTYNNSMPPFPLSDQEIANVLTYVYNSFGNSGIEVTPDEVKAQR
jgi:mono/diheme cytochrome c family protein